MLGWGKVEPFYPDEETPKTHDDYIQLAEECFQQLEKWRNSLEGWTPIQHGVSGVYFYEQVVPGFSLPMFRVEGTLPAAVHEVFPLIDTNDIEKKKEYDTFIQHAEVLEQITPDICAVYVQYGAIYPVARRDFAAMKAKRELPDGTWVAFGQSINHKDRPRTDAFVRAKGKVGFYCSPIPGTPYTTKILGILLIDPMAYIPTWIINMVKSQAPKVFRVLGKILIDKYGKPSLRPLLIVQPEGTVLPKRRVEVIVPVQQGEEIVVVPEVVVDVDDVRREEEEEVRMLWDSMEEMEIKIKETVGKLSEKITSLELIYHREEERGLGTSFMVCMMSWPLVLVLIYHFVRKRRGMFVFWNWIVRILQGCIKLIDWVNKKDNV